MVRPHRFLVAFIASLAFHNLGCAAEFGRIDTIPEIAVTPIKDVACFRDLHIVAVIAERDSQILSFDPQADPIQVVRHQIPGRNAGSITSETSHFPSMVVASNADGCVTYRINTADQWEFAELSKAHGRGLSDPSVPADLVLAFSKQTLRGDTFITANGLVNGEFVELFRHRKPDIYNSLGFYAVSSDKRRMVVCEPNSAELPEYDTASGQVLRNISAPGTLNKRFTGAAFSPDGLRLVTSTVDGTVSLWDAKSGQVIRLIDKIGGSVTHDIRFLNQGKLLFVSRPMAEARRRSVVKFWDGKTFEPIVDIVSMLPLENDSSKTLTAVATSEDGARVVIGDSGGRVHIWTAPAGDSRFRRQDAP